jgi:hypothetical protein
VRETDGREERRPEKEENQDLPTDPPSKSTTAM